MLLSVTDKHGKTLYEYKGAQGTRKNNTKDENTTEGGRSSCADTSVKRTETGT